MVRIALAGCGYWGSRVLKAMQRTPGIELVAVYDEDPEQLQQVRRAYGESFSYADSFRELLTDASIDALALTVPTGAHFRLAEQALAAGKHIFIEKPFTENLAQAEHLQALAEEKGLIIHVDHIMIYHPAIRKMKELLERGETGEIRYMEMRRTSSGGARADVTVLQDLSVHDLAIVDYLTDGKAPVSARSMSEKLGFPQPAVAFTVLKYPEFSVQLTASWVSPVKERRIILGGTEKTLVFDEILAPDTLMLYDREDPEHHQVIKTEEGNALVSSLAHFGACVKSRTGSLTDAQSAVRIAKILEEI